MSSRHNKLRAHLLAHTLVEQRAFYGGSGKSLLSRVRLVHSTKHARKNGSILNFEKSQDPSNHLVARGRELVYLVFLGFLVSLVSLNKRNKINQTN